MKGKDVHGELNQKETAPRLSEKCGNNTITFHNPNNKKDSQLIAEDFISRASRNVVKGYLLNQGQRVRCEPDVFENKDALVGNSE